MVCLKGIGEGPLADNGISSILRSTRLTSLEPSFVGVSTDSVSEQAVPQQRGWFCASLVSALLHGASARISQHCSDRDRIGVGREAPGRPGEG